MRWRSCRPNLGRKHLRQFAKKAFHIERRVLRQHIAVLPLFSNMCPSTWKEDSKGHLDSFIGNSSEPRGTRQLRLDDLIERRHFCLSWDSKSSRILIAPCNVRPTLNTLSM